MLEIYLVLHFVRHTILSTASLTRFEAFCTTTLLKVEEDVGSNITVRVFHRIMHLFVLLIQKRYDFGFGWVGADLANVVRICHVLIKLEKVAEEKEQHIIC